MEYFLTSFQLEVFGKDEKSKSSRSTKNRSRKTFQFHMKLIIEYCSIQADLIMEIVVIAVREKMIVWNGQLNSLPYIATCIRILEVGLHYRTLHSQIPMTSYLSNIFILIYYNIFSLYQLLSSSSIEIIALIYIAQRFRSSVFIENNIGNLIVSNQNLTAYSVK